MSADVSDQSNAGNGPNPSGRPLKLGVVFLTLYIDLVGFSIIFPLFPEMLEYYLGKDGDAGLLGALLDGLNAAAASLGIQNGYLPVLFGGVLGSLYSFLQFAFAPVWGGLSDKYGRRRILIITCAGTALSYLLWVFSGNFGLLVLARLFGGAMSGNLSVATAAVADVTTPENRAKGMGMVGAAFGLGFVTGPAIGGLCAQWNLLESHPGWATIGINPFSVPAMAACLLAVVNFGWVVARFAESLPAKARQEEHPVQARSPLRLLRLRFEPTVARIIFVYFVFIFTFSGMEFTLAFLAVQRFGFSTLGVTGMMVFVGFVLIVTQGMIVRRIVPWWGERRVAMGGLILVCAGFVILAQAEAVALLYLGLGVMAVGSGCATPALTALVSLAASRDRQGAVLGSFRAFGSLARAFGPIIAAVMFFLWTSRVSYLCAAVLMLAPIFVGLGLPMRRPRVSHGEPV